MRNILVLTAALFVAGCSTTTSTRTGGTTPAVEKCAEVAASPCAGSRP